MIKQNGENFEIVYQLGGDHEYHASNTPLLPTISFTSVGIDHLHLLRVSNVLLTSIIQLRFQDSIDGQHIQL